MDGVGKKMKKSGDKKSRETSREENYRVLSASGTLLSLLFE